MTHRIKVASYNIRKALGNDRRRSPERVVDVLHELDADVIALQEADMRFGARHSVLPPHMLADRGGWKAAPVAVRPGSMGWHGNAILVRHEADVLSSDALHLPTLEPRGAVTAVVRHGGSALRVVGMHLDLSGLWRRRQAGAILSYLDACPVAHPTVMMGDLNEWSRAGGCLRDFGRAFALAPTGPSFHARRPVGRLDRIMVSAGLAVADAGVHATPLARQASDHLPVWAVLEST